MASMPWPYSTLLIVEHWLKYYDSCHILPFQPMLWPGKVKVTIAIVITITITIATASTIAITTIGYSQFQQMLWPGGHILP